MRTVFVQVGGPVRTAHPTWEPRPSLARCYSRSRNPDSRALLRLAEAISYLETHFEDPVDLDELASTAHLSKRSFIRAFRAAMGSSPIAYLIQLR
ncbi:MAG: hypothetical protein QOE66_1176, partial [Chloroflexota bacterium]|nr:hypothetical protein [Chloroflexota bacterium]